MFPKIGKEVAKKIETISRRATLCSRSRGQRPDVCILQQSGETGREARTLHRLSHSEFVDVNTGFARNKAWDLHRSISGCRTMELDEDWI